jgi:acetyl-CoA acyltransferase 1
MLAIFGEFSPVYYSGARCVATLLNEMKRRGKDCRFGVISMCIGDFLF